VDCERCILYLYDPVLKALHTKAIRGPKINSFTIQPDRGVIGKVYNSHNGLIIKSPYEDLRFDRSLDKNRRSVTRNLLCVPLKVGQRCIGCLEIANKRVGEFTEQNYKLAVMVARELAVGVIEKKEFIKHDIEFKENVGRIATENLLRPLLKNILLILAETLSCEKYT
jgi:GAF domain-containing protein